MSEHPYRRQPPRAFWSRAVSAGFSAEDLQAGQPALIRPHDRVVSAGSCFASNLVPWLERAGVEYVRTEQPHPTLAHLPDNLGYRSFSAAYGNIYSSRQMRQLIDRVTGEFAPREDRWYVGEHVVDPFRPGLRYPARSDAEFDMLARQHLAAVQAALEAATVFVFTLGLTESWVSVEDGAAYPACPGVVAGTFHPDRHRFCNFSVSEVREDIEALVRGLRRLNPDVRVVLTVSPVPLVATASNDHVLVATTYSKAVLRAAAGEACESDPGIRYFPAFEIVTGPQAPEHYFLPDRRGVSDGAIEAVMTTLLGDLAIDNSSPQMPGGATGVVGSSASEPAGELSRRVAEAECDEVLADV